MLFNRSKVKQPLAIKFKHNEANIAKALQISDKDVELISYYSMKFLTTHKIFSVSKMFEYLMKNLDFEVEAKHLVLIAYATKSGQKLAKGLEI